MSITGPIFFRYGAPPKPIKMVYPNIVSREGFTPGSSLQAFDQTQNDALNQGVFDYKDGKIKDYVNPVLIAIRSGKLEQPDIDKLVSVLEEVTRSQVSSDEKQAAQAQLDAINKARQEHLDNLTEFDKDSVGKE